MEHVLLTLVVVLPGLILISLWLVLYQRVKQQGRMLLRLDGVEHRSGPRRQKRGPLAYVSALGILGTVMMLGGCSSGEESPSPAPPATAATLQNSTFTFSDGAIFDPALAGSAVELAIGSIGGTVTFSEGGQTISDPALAGRAVERAIGSIGRSISEGPFVLIAPAVGGTIDGQVTVVQGEAQVGTFTMHVTTTNQPRLQQLGPGAHVTYEAQRDPATGALTLSRGGQTVVGSLGTGSTTQTVAVDVTATVSNAGSHSDAGAKVLVRATRATSSARLNVNEATADAAGQATVVLLRPGPGRAAVSGFLHVCGAASGSNCHCLPINIAADAPPHSILRILIVSRFCLSGSPGG